MNEANEQAVIAKAREMMLACDTDPDATIALLGGYGSWLDEARAVLAITARHPA